MTSVLSFLASMWEGFKSITIPGVGISFASLMLGSFIVRFSVSLFSRLFGSGGGAGGSRPDKE